MKPDRNSTAEEGVLTFPRQTGVREAALLLVRDKGGRYSLLREPLYLDRCVIATDPAWQSYFEVQELLGKDTFIFKVYTVSLLHFSVFDYLQQDTFCIHMQTGGRCRNDSNVVPPTPVPCARHGSMAKEEKCTGKHNDQWDGITILAVGRDLLCWRWM